MATGPNRASSQHRTDPLPDPDAVCRADAAVGNALTETTHLAGNRHRSDTTHPPKGPQTPVSEPPARKVPCRKASSAPRSHHRTPSFPGWRSFGAMVDQVRFVRDRHKRIKRIGVVTDSHLGDVAEHLTSHFVSAEIRHFPAGQIEAARQWIMNGS